MPDPGPAPLFARSPILIGMVHLAPLPGSPRYSGSMAQVVDRAARDAQALAGEGCDGLLLENFGDAPFHPDGAPPETIAAMAVVLTELRRVAPATAWGVNVLRNDARGALGLAAAANASFLRINVHTGAVATDQGLLTGRAHETLRLRAALAPGVLILADAGVKHGRPIAPLPLEEEVRDLCERGLADAVLVTGNRTGEPPRTEDLRAARAAAGSVPVLAASGVTPENATAWIPYCSGFIAGTWLKRDGQVGNPVDRERVRALVAAVRGGHAPRS